MRITRVSVVIAVIAGIIIYFLVPPSDFFVYFGIPAIIIVNTIRIMERKNINDEKQKKM
ncbi:MULTISPECIES: hypothetical protein [Enterococcus]|uniref:hypothetical protein n=1 Tax=Enterococcus TaxID=1350 RepID=UPI001788B0B4|nr:hypothetical protein [Enterococcus avium]HBI1562654.1 hypothetical protein [Enterococcus faecalis]HBI1565794.1 hypothetical protein [Enterococcus faecalis]HBI1718065.1 hypothetical protein [Enterococcus faecalis]HBI1721043.1 hypothetical protein [Enterococcus faecalis]HBI1724059.1 hypothetical protein [Enterococcus faecalis]